MGTPFQVPSLSGKLSDDQVLRHLIANSKLNTNQDTLLGRLEKRLDALELQAAATANDVSLLTVAQQVNTSRITNAENAIGIEADVNSLQQAVIDANEAAVAAQPTIDNLQDGLIAANAAALAALSGSDPFFCTISSLRDESTVSVFRVLNAVSVANASADVAVVDLDTLSRVGQLRGGIGFEFLTAGTYVISISLRCANVRTYTSYGLETAVRTGPTEFTGTTDDILNNNGFSDRAIFYTVAIDRDVGDAIFPYWHLDALPTLTQLNFVSITRFP